MHGVINPKLENAPVTPISPKAKAILAEINIVESARKVAKVKITCPVLGAGPHDVENYKKRELVKSKIKDLGHNSFFLEEISAEDTKKFLMNEGFSKIVVESLAGNEERKNDAIFGCCGVIFALATNEGSLIEISKCCGTGNEEKLKVLVPENKYHEFSQAKQTLGELKGIYKNVFTYKDDEDLKKQVEDIIIIELTRIIRKK